MCILISDANELSIFGCILLFTHARAEYMNVKGTPVTIYTYVCPAVHSLPL